MSQFRHKIVRAEPRELEGMRKTLGKSRDWSRDDLDNIHYKSKKSVSAQGTLKKSRLIITTLVQWMTLYQLECSLSILKISVAEWLQITTLNYWLATNTLSKGIEVSSLLSNVQDGNPELASRHEWQIAHHAGCIVSPYLWRKKEIQVMSIPASDYALQRPAEESSGAWQLQ